MRESFPLPLKIQTIADSMATARLRCKVTCADYSLSAVVRGRALDIIRTRFRFSRGAENNVVSGRSGFRFNARRYTLLTISYLIAEVQAQ